MQWTLGLDPVMEMNTQAGINQQVWASLYKQLETSHFLESEVVAVVKTSLGTIVRNVGVNLEVTRVHNLQCYSRCLSWYWLTYAGSC